MGLVLDSSVLIASEKVQLNLTFLLQKEAADQQVVIAAITASELLHGYERAPAGQRKDQRKQFVEEILDTIPVLPFNLDIAREHARLWARLATSGELIGAHDLLIAATSLKMDYSLATLNMKEFLHVVGLKLIDIEPYKIHGE